MIRQLGLTEAYCVNSVFGLSPEELADGSYILPGDVLKALSGKPFRYYPSQGDFSSIDGVLPVHSDAVPVDVWNHYFKQYLRFLDFGLPNGGGWIDEEPWLIEFLEYMLFCKRQIESWNIKRMR